MYGGKLSLPLLSVSQQQWKYILEVCLIYRTLELMKAFGIYSYFSITFDLLFPMLIFFIAYLIHFVMRLVRYKKEKAALLAQK